ncbi:DUF1826 domain-containing protein [Porticoccus sp. W117]|uniref:DUF1826 domain-containing protein n=1 Tax=Porticoccus sp. W117 TaxID=3054777 RepID=UPI0025944199|nr:DUF1826 domain-containing protein [Porticoccus sp. W117]MDM3870009.1 DUF1826 domain-containing protein [Porticoccus sp. W117]
MFSVSLSERNKPSDFQEKCMSAIAVQNNEITPAVETRSVIEGVEPTVLADIYQAGTNIVVWQRHSIDSLVQAADRILEIHPTLQTSLTVTPQSACAAVGDALGTTGAAAVLSEDIAQLVDMFCYLFELKRAGLRLTALDRAMCPRFHVDRVPCRLVTTYKGVATQWLPHHLVDRSKLGAGSQGMPDEESGLFDQITDIQQLNEGNVALLKGELWEGNENTGLVHRSPAINSEQRRLLLTLDFISG